MPVQFSDALRHARLNQIEVVVSATPTLRILSGTKPATVATAETGTLLCDITLPADYLNPAAAGAVTKLGTWSGTGTAGAGGGTAAGYFRLLSAGTAHAQGTITATGGGGDLILDPLTISTGQTVTISTFTISEANA